MWWMCVFVLEFCAFCFIYQWIWLSVRLIFNFLCWLKFQSCFPPKEFWIGLNWIARSQTVAYFLLDKDFKSNQTSSFTALRNIRQIRGIHSSNWTRTVLPRASDKIQIKVYTIFTRIEVLQMNILLFAQFIYGMHSKARNVQRFRWSAGTIKTEKF